MSNGLDPDQISVVMSVLSWVQTVCNGYHQAIKVAASKTKELSTKISCTRDIHYKMPICQLIEMSYMYRPYVHIP